MSIKSMTLLELLISIFIVSVMVLSFYSLETYSHSQVIYSDRRAKVQTDLNYALEYMSKYVQQANGYNGNPGIEILTGSPPGFRVRVDLNSTQTPADTNDDAWVSYTLTGNTLSVSCAPIGGGSCEPFASLSADEKDLSSRIITGFDNTFMPNPMPTNPPSGFYVLIGDQGSSVEIGLAGLYDTSASSTTASHLTTNPQVGMKTRVICNSCSAN